MNANPAIETTDLTKHYGAVAAVDGVSLRVNRGEIYAFLGLNGTGKTTTMGMVSAKAQSVGGSADWPTYCSLIVAGTAGLTILLVTPIAFFAGIGRGYLAPMGAAIFLVVLAQIVAAAGWGEFFPWAIPALHAGMAGPSDAQMGIVSYLLVLATALAGMVATLWWWEKADQID